MNAHNAARDELARRSFLDFAHYAMRPSFQEKWYHATIARALQSLERGEITRLIIDAPPRHGKSQLVSRLFPAWVAGRHPDWNIIGTSYSDQLAQKMSRDVARVVNDDPFRRLWPDWRLGHKRAQAEWDFAGGGGYRAAGVGTGITGRGANLAIVDDPIKSRKEADSNAVRDTLWGWFNDDLMTRLESPSLVVVMATRWHEDDLTGRLLSAEPDQWHHVHIPAIFEGDSHADDPRAPGEALWAERYPIEGLLERRRRDPHGFESLYQGNPIPKIGGLFRVEGFRHYMSTPEAMAAECDWQIISVDATMGASKNSDFVEIMVVGGKGRRLFVLDDHHERMDFNQTKAAIRAMRAKWPRAQILIETKANGPALINDLARELGRVTGFDPKSDSKEARAQFLASMVEGGDVFLPTALLCSWVPAFLAEFAGFPAKKHDDRVDALSQVALYKMAQPSALDHLKRICGGGWMADRTRWLG